MLNIQKNEETNTIRDQNGIVISEPSEIAESFNDYFINIGKKLAKRIEKPLNYVEHKKIHANTIFMNPTDEQEIKNVIFELKNKKAPGFDGLKAETLKLISDDIKKPLTVIINRSLETGEFPSAFKLSVVTPIYKSGDKTDMNNYRPISLISNLAKILEKILKIRLSKFINKYKLLSPTQYGFREGKSTQDAIQFLTGDIYNALDKGIPSIAIFIDLTKAFDTVDHSILLGKLEDIGIRGTSYELFKNYLTDREQILKVKQTTSQKALITCGIPQGTVLGPILFTIYLNDLLCIEKSGKIISFADDTVLFYTDNNWYDLRNKIQTDLNKLKMWFDYNLLSINFDKTHYLPFSSQDKSLPTFDITLKKFTIKPTEKIKYLGIIMDPHLRWDEHISYLLKKLRCILYRFKHVTEFLDQNQKIILYKTLVEPHLKYAIIGWGGVSRTYLDALEVSQRRFLKIILNKNSRYPSDQVYNETKTFDLRQIYFEQLNIAVFKKKLTYTTWNIRILPDEKANLSNR